VRMHVRRFTRLTNAHSKSAAHHDAMVSLFVAWYNFCRKHEALKYQTPGMSSGLTDTVWSIEELLRQAATLTK
jgi:Integrase core domain